MITIKQRYHAPYNESAPKKSTGDTFGESSSDGEFIIDRSEP